MNQEKALWLFAMIMCCIPTSILILGITLSEPDKNYAAFKYAIDISKVLASIMTTAGVLIALLAYMNWKRPISHGIKIEEIKNEILLLKSVKKIFNKLEFTSTFYKNIIIQLEKELSSTDDSIRMETFVSLENIIQSKGFKNLLKENYDFRIDIANAEGDTFVLSSDIVEIRNATIKIAKHIMLTNNLVIQAIGTLEYMATNDIKKGKFELISTINKNMNISDFKKINLLDINNTINDISEKCKNILYT
jgi:hypothetical protein